MLIWTSAPFLALLSVQKGVRSFIHCLSKNVLRTHCMPDPVLNSRPMRHPVIKGLNILEGEIFTFQVGEEQ